MWNEDNVGETYKGAQGKHFRPSHHLTLDTGVFYSTARHAEVIFCEGREESVSKNKTVQDEEGRMLFF